MKTVIDLEGKEVEVSLDIPVKTINGKHYLLSINEQEEVVERESKWQVELTRRNAIEEIKKLEGEITQRRLREAILGTDNGWLAKQESLIANERKKIGK